MSGGAQSLRIGVISDGKAGHSNQSLGLADALQRRVVGLSVTELPPLSTVPALTRLLWSGRSRDGFALLIGAGHGTHLSLLALGRVERCPTIVLMRPSLPGRFFTLCIEPRHDGGRESDRRWLSEGPLNRMRPQTTQPEGGLMLIGGPSPHYRWDSQAILYQIEALCDGQNQWRVSSSRRTPMEFMTTLEAMSLPGLQVHRAEELPAGWLAQQLPRARDCWVTPDSASMVYEALTAGCAVGLFDLTALGSSRVAGAMVDLVERGLVTGFSGFDLRRSLPAPAQVLAEADRCAERILERGWL